MGTYCEDDFGWTYSLGIYDTCAQPELITVGLPLEVAKHCLNEAARRMRAGIDVTKERQKELIANVDCELRIVSPNWVDRLMNFASWFNGSADYPVLQVIYPNLQNRFQWEESFENRFIQPLLQMGTPCTPVDQQFWDSINLAGSFPTSRTQGCSSRRRSRKTRSGSPNVSHDLSDGAWQILGETGVESGGPELACLHHMVDKDANLAELADLQKAGMQSERHRENLGNVLRVGQKNLKNESMRQKFEFRASDRDTGIERIP